MALQHPLNIRNALPTASGIPQSIIDSMVPAGSQPKRIAYALPTATGIPQSLIDAYIAQGNNPQRILDALPTVAGPPPPTIISPDRANASNVFPGLDWGGVGAGSIAFPSIPGNTASFVDEYPSADLAGDSILRFTGSLGVTVMDLRLVVAPLVIPAGAWDLKFTMASNDNVTTNARMILELNNSTGPPIVTRNAYWPADTNPHVPPDIQLSNTLTQYTFGLTAGEIALMDPTKQPWRCRLSYSGGALSILRNFDCSNMVLEIPT